MSKKTQADREKEEEKDLEEEEEEGSEGDEEGDEEEEEEERPAPAKAAREQRARPKASAHEDEEDDDHDHEDEEGDDEELDDPTWWAPHAVLAALVVLGVLGFFGVFNKVLGGLAAKPGGAATTEATTAAAAQPDTFGARHLLVQYKGARSAGPSITRSEDEAKTRAAEAMKKAKGGAKFEDLVKEYSDEPGAGARGGDLGKFKKGQMVPEFQTAVEKLKVGEVSDLVKTPFGYHVILRTQ